MSQPRGPSRHGAFCCSGGGWGASGRQRPWHSLARARMPPGRPRGAQALCSPDGGPLSLPPSWSHTWSLPAGPGQHPLRHRHGDTASHPQSTCVTRRRRDSLTQHHHHVEMTSGLFVDRSGLVPSHCPQPEGQRSEPSTIPCGALSLWGVRRPGGATPLGLVPS